MKKASEFNPDMNVREFALWWLRAKPFKQPPDNIVHTGPFAGVTLFREGPFQVQMFIGKPGATAPAHRHPNIDSVEYGVGGNGEQNFKSERNAHRGALFFVEPNELHIAQAGSSGGAFISIQKWLNGVEPTSVEQDWIGDPLDEKHAAEIGA